MTPRELFKKLHDDVDKDVQFRYWKRFKTEYGSHVTLGFSWLGGYTLTEKLPEETAEHFEELMRRSLADNHDHLLDYAKKHGKKTEIVYEPDKVY